MELNNPRVIKAWCLYDWANSVYNLVITSTIFPVYYIAVTTSGDSDLVNFFGFSLPNTVLYSYSLSFSFLVVAAMQPILSGIADYSGNKKNFMKFFTWLGGLSCICLFFFDGENVEFGITCSVFASIGYGGALVFYNSYLPEIATYDQYDTISAKGFSYGYIGSVLLLIFNLVMIQKPEWFGLTPGNLPAKISFLTVGVWWIGFAQITFYNLPENTQSKKIMMQHLLNGYNEIRKVWFSLAQLPDLKKYLRSFFFYNTGVQTIMYLAATFGSKELELSAVKLIMSVLIIQLVAIPGSFLFARLSNKSGNRFSLSTMVIMWIFICIAAYLVQNEFQFYALAFSVGLIMGGIQSLSRATFTKLMPANTIDHASYFSFYSVTYNISTVIGTFAFGFIEQLTGSMRNSALSLGGFFVIGFILLLQVRIPRSEKEAYKLD
ncbi:MAG: MFS transporter [Bacteroidetes bacterium]|nr:MFS transporter [Bacteroidota bacterium]